MTQRNVRIRVPVLTRVEGEGALELDINDFFEMFFVE